MVNDEGGVWAFGHSKLVEPLDIQEPIRLSITECSDVSTTQILTKEDGRQICVAKGSKAMYKYLDAGEVMLLDGNVACEGGELKIGGEEALEYCGVRHHRVLSPHCQSD